MGLIQSAESRLRTLESDLLYHQIGNEKIGAKLFELHGALKGVPGKNPFFVSYGDFGADGKTMVQLHNAVQPRDAYYTRC